MVMIILMAVFGMIFGSFACCQAWRWHSRGKKLPKRSCCMKCRHKLSWWENIPVLSWVMLGGKCRHCRKPIGAAEIITEVLMGAAFVGCYLAEGDVGALVILLTLLVVLGVLAVYDGKWGELPTGLLIVAIGLAVAYLGVRGEIVWWNVAASVALTAGTYFLTYTFSRGKLCGDGDWLLGVAIGVALGDWWLALVCLAVSNLLAAAVSLPMKRKKVFFGPFFVVGFVMVLSLREVLCIACLI